MKQLPTMSANPDELNKTLQVSNRDALPAPTAASPGALLAPPQPAKTQIVKAEAMELPVVLQPSPLWSRVLLWTMMGGIAATVSWACLAKIEAAVPAQGKLEPQGAVKEVQAPMSGVVQAVYVEDGRQVKQGEVLLRLNPTATQAEINSLKAVRAALVQENRFYQSQMQPSPSSPSLATPGKTVPKRLTPEQTTVQLKLTPATISLTRNRAALVAENQLYRSLLKGDSVQQRFSPEQLAFIQTSQRELGSRVAAARLEVQQLENQLSQNQIELTAAERVLSVNQEILGDLKPLADEGVIARNQYRERLPEILRGEASIEQLTKERGRLQLAIAQANQQLNNVLAAARKELLTQVADNEKRIAEIDSQLSKLMVDNQNRIAEIEGQLAQVKLALQYQELRAPINGTIFDLKASNPGFVTDANQVLLKIVPPEDLIAKVFITNRDIGFVREDMAVDVRIDSFPFSEFGDIKGSLIWIGSDALPPDDIYPFYRFPAKIQLNRQALQIDSRTVALQSGMSLSANIKLRDRRIITLFSDLFTRQIDRFKHVR